MITFGIITGTIVFIILWGWGWGEADIFERAWWFDTLGHVTAGFGGALALLHLLKNSALGGFFRIRGKIFLMFAVVAIVAMIQSHGWEGLESVWDYILQPLFFPHLAKAQKNGLDTTIDNLMTTSAATLAMRCWWYYDRSMRHRETIEEEEIEEALELMETLSEKIRTKRREHLRRLLPSFKKLRHLIKTKMEIKK